jgi:hypothetical protein
MAEAPKVDPVEAARSRVHATLQILWTKAGMRSSYVKGEWLELEAAIDALRDVAAADATEWMRAEITKTLEGLPELLLDLAQLSRSVSLNAEAEKAERKAEQAATLLERVKMTVASVSDG